ncbi:zinc finger X-chromosomal protein [Platysternon megacephalum]|uniref:Zinc finger X-chromosomal protein n=1 Tax=Platysternon megacephalum TaxID=55544 RepID=A0A4D9EHF3_9SAUR|nr:zinc finger X-chromosomal protein [Platysternon megacephalum]
METFNGDDEVGEATGDRPMRDPCRLPWCQLSPPSSWEVRMAPEKGIPTNPPSPNLLLRGHPLVICPLLPLQLPGLVPSRGGWVWSYQTGQLGSFLSSGSQQFQLLPSYSLGMQGKRLVARPPPLQKDGGEGPRD